MPIYEYECLHCKHVFEFLVINTKYDNVSCPKCNSLCQQIVSTPNFHLKGSGWSKDGYSSKKETALDRVPK